MATTRCGKTKRSSPTSWKMFLKRSMICRASMSWEAETQTVVGSHRKARFTLLCEAGRRRRRRPAAERPLPRPPRPAGLYLLAVVPTLKMAACQGDLLAVCLLHTALLLRGLAAPQAAGEALWESGGRPARVPEGTLRTLGIVP